MKGGLELDPENWRPKGIQEYARLCGWALALAHAKSGDAAMIRGARGQERHLGRCLLHSGLRMQTRRTATSQALTKAAREKRIPVATKF